MNPKLGLMSQGKFEEIRELSNTEYEKYQKAATRLMCFSSDQQLYTIVLLNYDDYKNLLGRYSEEYVKNPRMGWLRIERMVLDLNRYILNYLSAVRTFLDHTETNIKKRYGKNSQRARRFKDACSNAYDKYFSYRFLCGLRNYAQHCGMPLGELTLQSVEIDPYSKEVRHCLAVKFDRDKLLSNFRWRKLTNEIKNLPAKFEITPHLTQMMKCLERINLTVIGDDLQELIQSAGYIQQLIKHIKDMDGTPCIFRIKELVRSPEGKVKQLKVDIENIPLHVVEIIMNIKKQV